MYLNKSDKESLCLFNEKVEELYRSGFPFSASVWREKNNTLMKMSLVNGNITDIEMFFPEENEIKSFIMTYKVLTQKNDPCSLVKIGAIYDKLPDTIEEKKKFKDFRNEINSFLDSNSGISSHGTPVKRSMIVDYMINSLYAHVDKSKKIFVDKWMSHPLLDKFYKHEFINSLVFVSDRFFQINLVNNSVIKDSSLFVN